MKNLKTGSIDFALAFLKPEHVSLGFKLICEMQKVCKTRGFWYYHGFFLLYLLARKLKRQAGLMKWASLLQKAFPRIKAYKKQAFTWFSGHFFSSHSIYSHGKILDTDLRVTDFRVTVLFVSLGITKFTSQGKRSHWNFFLEKHAEVPEKLTVTEKKLHWIYFPQISVPEFAVTNAKNTEFSYNPPRRL